MERNGLVLFGKGIESGLFVVRVAEGSLFEEDLPKSGFAANDKLKTRLTLRVKCLLMVPLPNSVLIEVCSKFKVHAYSRARDADVGASRVCTAWVDDDFVGACNRQSLLCEIEAAAVGA